MIDGRDRAWVVRIRAGDPLAFEAMYRAYKNDLGAYVASLVRSPEAAEDIIHDLFVQIWERRHAWECPGALASYLFRAARNRALNHLRHERVGIAYQARIEQAAAAPDRRSVEPQAHIVVAEHENERALENALERLSPRVREVFLLNRRLHLTYAEVAVRLGISPNTVEVHITRALKELRHALRLYVAGAVAILTLLNR